MITIDNYKEELKGLCAIEFSGESCANCLSLLPVVNEICSVRNIPVKHIEVNEDSRAIVEHFEIQMVPTLILAYDGVEFARCRGYQPDEILEIWIDAKIDEFKNKEKRG